MMRLKLSKEIYSAKNINDAIIMYSDLGKIKLKSDKCYWILIFTQCKYGTERTIKEFENYVIGLENN